jgi:hypothetical protein
MRQGNAIVQRPDQRCVGLWPKLKRGWRRRSKLVGSGHL